MSTPQPENPKDGTDLDFEDFLKTVDMWNKKKKLSNLGHKLLKDGARKLKHLVAEIEFYQEIMLQKKIGGHKGATK